MSFALIEVEATAKKAARGAGYAWGMAEEAAKATRWLCAQGIDGVAALAVVLVHVDGSDPGQRAPGALPGDWRGLDGEICPLIAGAALSDSALDWADDGKRMQNVLAPVLLLPFAAMAARALGTAVTLDWAGAQAVTDGVRLDLRADDTPVLLETAAQVSVRRGGRLERPRATETRARPTDADWADLNRFAQRTYAPDTEESRLRGAGAGLSDND